ncbi:hypothetical protein AALO_G00269980 [Alosa alosa]|uniref:Uncharacterized protein n=1 Tax=Alosa alosa TaxID=278164 RepID=A0AAV6FM45_9TELE|nr:hypothetical protein AALO_G00269980 [Alosa alosa]
MLYFAQTEDHRRFDHLKTLAVLPRWTPRVCRGCHCQCAEMVCPIGYQQNTRMEPFLQIAPHSLAIVLARTGGDDSPGVTESDAPPHHHTGYEIFADFKSENMQHFWNKMVSDAIAETFFLGWIDEHVLLIQGKEDHLEVLREGWMRRTLKPPQGFDIKYLVSHEFG